MNATSTTKKDQSKLIASALIKKLKTQVEDAPGARLMFSVFEQAVLDVVVPGVPDGDRESAKRYLKSKMPHLELSGIEIKYAERVMKDLGFYDLLK